MANRTTLDTIKANIDLFSQSLTDAVVHLNNFLAKVEAAKPKDIRANNYEKYNIIATKIEQMREACERDRKDTDESIQKLENLKEKYDKNTELFDKIMKEINNKRISKFQDLALATVEGQDKSKLSDTDLTLMDQALVILKDEKIRGGKGNQNNKTKKRLSSKKNKN
jgi:hypothetical protein